MAEHDARTMEDPVAELAAILARLRGPGGCPWDREQTHDSLKRFLIEECGELLDALDEGDDRAIVDELGDVLLQVVFHAQIASEQGRFDLADVARSECEKMLRRHPHVFGGAVADTADHVVDQWERIKRDERGGAALPSPLAGVPRHLPSLHRAQRLQGKAEKARLAAPANESGVLAALRSRLDELEATPGVEKQAASPLLGEILFAVVQLCRLRGVEAEDALQQTLRAFERAASAKAKETTSP